MRGAPDASSSASSDVSPRVVDGTAPAAGPWPDGVLDIRGLKFEQIEQLVYRWALRNQGGSRRKAARALGLARSTFCDKVKRFGIA